MDLRRRRFIAATIAAGAPWAAPRLGLAYAAGEVFRPEDFGAKGDGSTNDTAAFAAMAEAVNRRGGGEVVLRKTVYIAGAQRPSAATNASYAFEPAPIMEFRSCSLPLLIRGNGATLRCAPGLRFGTFSRATGRATRHSMPYMTAGEVASPYRFMVRVEGCSGSVEIMDLELDGNLPHLQLGGPWGDVGHQVPGTGIGLVNNSGFEAVRRVRSHHHPLDGVLIDGLDAPRAQGSVVEDVTAEYNGRQGCSIVGGRNYSFARCKFNHTGRAQIASPPSSGVDIEAEAGKKVRRIRFAGCEFSNNVGAGMVADSGDAQDIAFSNCTFIGTTNWAAWPNQPGTRFSACRFVGPIVRAYGNTSRPDLAAKFYDCSFLDDPALSPTGRIYGGENPDRPIADLPDNAGVLFCRCTFNLTHDSVLPWTTNVVIFQDCRMTQRAARQSFPRGQFIGRNVINAPHARLSYGINRGHLVLNGRELPQGPIP